MKNKSLKKERDISIQILRVCACFMVFIVHFGQRVGFGGFLRELTEFGKYGVQLFFLISGFLVGKTFYNNPNISIKEYYKKRIITILPLYYIVIIYYFITENILNHYLNVIPVDHLGVGWFRYLFLLNGFLNSDTYFWSNLGITWTIPVFCFFYLVAPLVLRKVKTVFSSLIIWGAVFIATKIAGIYYPCVIFSNIQLLFLGVVLFYCVNKKVYRESIIAFLMIAIGMTIIGNSTYVYVSLFSCIILILVTMKEINLPGCFKKIINVLDKYSYTLYLMHGVIFCSILDRLNLFGVSKITIGLIAIVGTFLSTLIVGKFIEKPIQKKLTKKFIGDKIKK